MTAPAQKPKHSCPRDGDRSRKKEGARPIKTAAQARSVGCARLSDKTLELLLRMGLDRTRCSLGRGEERQAGCAVVQCGGKLGENPLGATPA
jgi:hypothetical protein